MTFPRDIGCEQYNARNSLYSILPARAGRFMGRAVALGFLYLLPLGLHAEVSAPSAAVMPLSARVKTTSSTLTPSVLLAAPLKRADFAKERPSREARQIADRIVDSNDSRGLPFVIIDKTNAKIFAFNAGGLVLGAAPALLGSARGDESVPGIGERKLSEIRPEERTTPAGRFVAESGRNSNGEDIVWVDYDAAVSLHRVRANNPQERRLQRLASPTPKDNRISYGCINVPAHFYNTVISPMFANSDGIVYVLPETRAAQLVPGRDGKL